MKSEKETRSSLPLLPPRSDNSDRKEEKMEQEVVVRLDI